jgi:hypothetical protein
MSASFLGTFIKIHYLYLCTIVQYLFLFTGFLVLSRPLKQKVLKVALCGIIFLPVNEYNALILIGHPYSSQLFTGALFILFMHLLRKNILQSSSSQMDFLKGSAFGFAAILFFFAGIWVSEFNAVLALMPVVFLLGDKELRKSIASQIKKKQALFLLFLMAASFILLTIVYIHTKNMFLADAYYNKMLIDNWVDLKRNIDFFIQKLTTALFFKDKMILENFFNWFLIAFSGFLFIRGYNKSTSGSATLFSKSLIITCIVAILLLFLSRWNLRSEFSPRYFTPVYILFCYYLLVKADQIKGKSIPVLSCATGLLFFSFSFCYTHEISRADRKTPMEKYGEFTRLPRGTLIADYWDTYAINSIATDNLQSLPYDHLMVRNWDWRQEALNQENIYFLTNGRSFPKDGLTDPIMQYGNFFKYSGKSYICNGIEVRLYHSYFRDHQQFALKASNGMYLQLDADAHVSADQPDSSKACTFKIVALRDGYQAFMVPGGKYVCANLSKDGLLFSNSENAWAWETFYICLLKNKKVNIKTLNSKFVSVDSTQKNRLIANKILAGQEETFIFEPR